MTKEQLLTLNRYGKRYYVKAVMEAGRLKAYAVYESPDGVEVERGRFPVHGNANFALFAANMLRDDLNEGVQ